MDHVKMLDLKESYPIAIAVDQNMPERLFIASGIESEEMGILSISNDYGTSFSTKKIPTCIHGNMNGRGVGNRLIVDPNNSNVLYFASQKGGLLKTTNLGDTWERLDLIESYTTFVWVSSTSQTIVVGTAGVRSEERLVGTVCRL